MFTFCRHEYDIEPREKEIKMSRIRNICVKNKKGKVTFYKEKTISA